MDNIIFEKILNKLEGLENGSPRVEGRLSTLEEYMRFVKDRIVVIYVW